MITFSGLFLPASRNPIAPQDGPQHWHRRIEAVEKLVGSPWVVSMENVDFGQYLFESFDLSESDERYLRLVDPNVGGWGIAPLSIPFTMRFKEVEERLVYHQRAIVAPVDLGL